MKSMHDASKTVSGARPPAAWTWVNPVAEGCVLVCCSACVVVQNAERKALLFAALEAHRYYMTVSKVCGIRP